MRVGRFRLGVHGQHTVHHRGPRGLVARILVIEEVTPKDIEPRLVHRVCRRFNRSILLNHRNVAKIAVVGNDLLAYGREFHRHTAHTDRPSGIEYLSCILKIILDKVRACAAIPDGCRLAGRGSFSHRLIPLGEQSLIPFLHKLPRVDCARQGVHIVVLSVTAVEGDHLMQEVCALVIACVIKEGCLPVIKRLGNTAKQRLVLI